MFRTIWLLLFIFVATSKGWKPNHDIVVALDGSGDYTSIQAAIDSVREHREKRTVIYLKNGCYDQEKLIVPEAKKNITLMGEDRTKTVIRYHVYCCNCDEALNGMCPVDSVKRWEGDTIRTSATLTIRGEGFRAENLTIENKAGPVGQALVITVQADKTVFEDCSLKSYQDTIYLWSAGCRTYFKNCLVVGRTDYIYGAGIGYFEDCEIRSWGGGWITAPATPKEQKYGFVFNRCAITYAENSPRESDDGRPFRLGRPWQKYPKVAWLQCEMSSMVHPEGWGDTWRMDYASTSADLHLYEFNNTGKGADMTPRAEWAGLRELTQLEARDYSVRKVMCGSDGWDPTED